MSKTINDFTEAAKLRRALDKLDADHKTESHELPLKLIEKYAAKRKRLYELFTSKVRGIVEAAEGDDDET